ncbi:hypothetical protein DUNSADRAFT_4536 [Dunaliella salina]|uniref:Uncharacterized protein n=1 Tax=Dunaliella salina TaxID=3046 RepID=A0ABQ7GRU5_DUNSA|nr:hypothetical protein DUNSADRAFT_4536 [Dunaliella salina]|eukprot:KAF5837328.1 hypothetical protein DUNSADRAFT_4536 [Dunaliella salina]
MGTMGLQWDGVGLMPFTHAKLWAAQEFVAAIFLLCRKQDFVKHYLPIFIAFALLIIAAATKKRTRLLKAAVFARSLLRMAMMLQLSVRGESLNLLRYGDLPTYLMTFLPELLILNWELGAPLFMFAFSHAGVSALFYYMANIHSVTTSILRGFGIHAVCYCVFLAIRCNINSHCKSATEPHAGRFSEVVEQLQKDEKVIQQPLQKERPSAKAQQQQGQHEEPAGGHLNNKHSDNVADSMPCSSMSMPLRRADMCAASSFGTAAANNCDLGTTGKPQLPCSGVSSGSQSASAQYHHPPESQGVVAPWSGSDASATSVNYSSGIVSKPTHQHPTASAIVSKPTHQHSTATASPLPKVVAESLKARTEMCGRNAYISKRSQPHSSEVKRRCLRAACRVAVKVHGPFLPDSLPPQAISNLQNGLRRSPQLMPCDVPAVRAGCLVISYGTLSCSEDCTMLQMQNELAAVTKGWAHEHGLLPSGKEGLLSVQACCQSSWGSISTSLAGLDCFPEHSLLVRQPFLETTMSDPELKPLCVFDLTLIAPSQDFELRGWQGGADAPEDLPDDVKSRSLCLLANVDGEFLATSVVQRRDDSSGEVSVQVQVSLPEAMRDATTLHPKVLVLELWAVGTLVCSYGAVLLPCAGALTELQGWADEAGGGRSCEERSAFVRDLVDWMHFHATCNSALKQRHQGAADMFIHEGLADQADEEVQEMHELGEDLLAHCLGHGMLTLAGMLLNVLASCPVSDAPFSLLDGLTPAAEQLAGSPVSQQQSCQQYSPSSDLQLDPSPAEQPEAAQQLADAPVSQQQGCQQHSSSPGQRLDPSSVGTPPLVPPTRTTAARSAQASKTAAAGRFSESSQEEEFQAWKIRQIAPLASCWCSIMVLCMGVGLLQNFCKRQAFEGKAAVFAEEGPLVPLVLAYAVGAHFIGKAGTYTELILAMSIAARACFAVLVGLGVVPVPEMLVCTGAWRVEVPSEALMMPVVEQVRMRWMIPLRLVLTLGIGAFYQSLHVAAPWFQAFALNACSLAIAKGIDLRYRRLHALALSNSKPNKDEMGDTQNGEALGCGRRKVLPAAKAGPSTAHECKL